jgi:hypothetical protein
MSNVGLMKMKKKLTIGIWSTVLFLASGCAADEWFSRNDTTPDFKYVNMFIQHVGQAKRVVITGKMHDTSNQLYDVRFTIETQEQKKLLQSYMTNLEIRETEPPSLSHPSFHGQLHYVDFTVQIVNVLDDHREYFSLSGPPLEAYLSSYQSFWIDSKKFDESEFYKFLSEAEVPCETIKYTGNPPQYVPSIILGSWHTEDNEVEIEFLDDGTFRFLNAPMSFCSHLSQVPDKYKIFHLIGEASEWEISDDLLSLRLRMAPPLENGTTGIWISRLDSEYLDFCCRDDSTLRFIRSKNKSNNKAIE